MRKHLGISATGFLLGILVYSYVHFSGFQNVPELLLSGLLGIAIAYITYLSNTWLDGLIKWQKLPGLRLLCGILIHAALALAVVYTVISVYNLLFKKPSIFLPDSRDALLKIAVLVFCISLIYSIIYFATYSYYQYAKGQLLDLKFRRKQTQLQLSALKSQLSPHFLFNSMNTLSSLFRKDVDKAENFIRSLAELYQYTLQTYEDPLVSLEKELSFVSSYCYLIKTRFGDYIKLSVDVPSDILQSKVPPLTLQMLVENAVKHNVVDTSNILDISITTRADRLVVSNNKTQKRPKIDSFKIGLRNISGRYKLLTDRQVEIVDSDTFIVQLPLIK